MFRYLRSVAFFLIAGALLLSAAPGAFADPFQIQFTTTNISSSTCQSCWQYTYLISGHDFLSGESFNVDFGSQYSNVDTAPPAPSGWTTAGASFDLTLNSAGFYTAQALANGSSLAGPFTVDFMFLGSGTPGSQTWELFDPNFATLQSGVTVAAVSNVADTPEPSSLLLMFTGGAACMGQLLRKRFRPAMRTSPGTAPPSTAVL